MVVPPTSTISSCCVGIIIASSTSTDGTSPETPTNGSPSEGRIGGHTRHPNQTYTRDSEPSSARADLPRGSRPRPRLHSQ
jgi:hypothetical protein